MMKHLFCALVLALSVGCATARMRPYVGEQQNWPTASGSIVNTKFDLPIFTTLPPAPYELIGELRIESRFYATPEEQHMPLFVKRAKKEGAEAIIFVQGRRYFSTNYGLPTGDPSAVAGGKRTTLTQVNTFNPDAFRPEVTIVAVRWVGEPPPGLPERYRRKPAPPAVEAETEPDEAEEPMVAAVEEEVEVPAEHVEPPADVEPEMPAHEEEAPAEEAPTEDAPAEPEEPAEDMPGDEELPPFRFDFPVPSE